jgi:uncharacterized protein
MAKWQLKPGDWCHIEFATNDREAAKRFYGSVFGWTFEEYPGMDYAEVITSEDGIRGGIGTLAGSVGIPSDVRFVGYLLPDDFDATLERIERAGGTVLIPKTDVHGFGWFAHFRDLDGNVVGLWKDAEPH